MVGWKKVTLGSTDLMPLTFHVNMRVLPAGFSEKVNLLADSPVVLATRGAKKSFLSLFWQVSGSGGIVRLRDI